VREEQGVESVVVVVVVVVAGRDSTVRNVTVATGTDKFLC
jgi:hypothetical protein